MQLKKVIIFAGCGVVLSALVISVSAESPKEKFDRTARLLDEFNLSSGMDEKWLKDLSVTPKEKKEHSTIIEFLLDNKGTIHDPIIVKSSGLPLFDKAVLKTIKDLASVIELGRPRIKYKFTATFSERVKVKFLTEVSTNEG